MARLNIALLSQRANERVELALGWWGGTEEAYPPHLTCLLCTYRQWPRRRATDCRNELSPPHEHPRPFGA